MATIQKAQLPNGEIIDLGAQFQIGDQKYPAGWLLTARNVPEMLASSKVEIIDVEIPDDPIPPVENPTFNATQFRALFTQEETLAITAAGNADTLVRIFIDEAAAAQKIDLTVDKVIQGLDYFQTKGLITPERRARIAQGLPPEE